LREGSKKLLRLVNLWAGADESRKETDKKASRQLAAAPGVNA